MWKMLHVFQKGESYLFHYLKGLAMRNNTGNAK